MNIENALKLREQLLSLPGKFDYVNYAFCEGKEIEEKYKRYRDYRPEVIINHPCQTAACVAGWCALLNVPEFKDIDDPKESINLSQEYLDLHDEEATFLFYPRGSSSKRMGFVGNEYDYISGYKLHDAIARLDHIIKLHTPKDNNVPCE